MGAPTWNEFLVRVTDMKSSEPKLPEGDKMDVLASFPLFTT